MKRFTAMTTAILLMIGLGHTSLTAASAATKLDAFNAKVLRGDYSCADTKVDEAAKGWALEYCKAFFDEYVVSGKTAGQKVMDTLTISIGKGVLTDKAYLVNVYTKYNYSFEMSKKQADGSFLTPRSLRLALFTVSHKTYLTGIFIGETNELNNLQNAYDLTAKIPSLKKKLAPYPSKNVKYYKDTNLSKLLPKDRIITMTTLMSKDILAVLTYTKSESDAEIKRRTMLSLNPGYYVNLTRVYYVDLKKAKITGQTDIPPYDARDIHFDNGRLYIDIDLDQKALTVVIDNGKLLPMKNGAYVRLSPDGSKVAYERDNNVYLSRADGSGEKLLIPKQDWPMDHCQPYRWIDNNRLFYTNSMFADKGNTMASHYYSGIVNASTGKKEWTADLFMLYAIAGNKVFLSPYGNSGWFAIDLNDPTYTAKPILKGLSLWNDYITFTPDGKDMIVFNDSRDSQFLAIDYTNKKLLSNYVFQSGEANSYAGLTEDGYLVFIQDDGLSGNEDIHCRIVSWKTLCG